MTGQGTRGTVDGCHRGLIDFPNKTLIVCVCRYGKCFAGSDMEDPGQDDVKTVIEMKNMADYLKMDFASYFGDLGIDYDSGYQASF